MTYQISRNGQMYGPYTLDDLQRYVASGNVLPTDMAKSEEMTEWLPVSQILGGSASAASYGASDVPASDVPASEFAGTGFATPAYTTAPGYTDPAYSPLAANAALAASPYPDAPNLHWGLYLLFTILTCSYFSKVFVLVQAAWLRRVQPNSNGLFFYLGMYAVWIASFFVGIGRSLSYLTRPHFDMHLMSGGQGSLFLLRLVLLFVARFVMSASLEEHFNGPEPVGLKLNPVLVFFFGGIYFQYKLNEINARKQAARFGAGRGF